MPTEEGLRLDQDEGPSPFEELAQEGQEPSGSIGRKMRSNLTFLKQSQLLAEEQVFGRQCATGFSGQEQQSRKIDQHLANALEQMNEAR